ncbi:hypothetical protein ABZ622_41780 [Streptomyces sp. NPDC007164]|uniref:hypothetical protein n=1 Tax=Streptomyces sp. NPDC007164 TaxID=3156918 RepID=UPI0033D00039
MAQAAANPYVMVKHGRREDRAAVYDRFIALCSTFYCGRTSDHVNDLFAALHAINLRAPRHIREAADGLFIRIVGQPYDPETLADWGVPVEEHHPSEAPYLGHEVRLVEVPLVPPDVNSTKVIASTFELREEIDTFVDLARIDVNGRWNWWHWPLALIPPLKRWQLAR